MRRRGLGNRSVDLRRKILDASLKMIASDGLEALSMREVARRLKVTHGAPYYHFTDRAEILTALAEEGIVALGAALKAGAEEGGSDPRARLEACGRAYVAFALAHPSHWKVMNRAELAIGGQRPEIAQAQAAAFAVLVEVVQQCQAAGMAPGLEPKALAMTGWSVAHGLASLLVDGQLTATVDPEFLNHSISHTFGALVSGATGAGPIAPRPVVARAFEASRKRRAKK